MSTFSDGSIDDRPDSGIYKKDLIKNGGRCPCTKITLRKPYRYKYITTECFKCHRFKILYWDDDDDDKDKERWLKLNYKKVMVIQL